MYKYMLMHPETFFRDLRNVEIHYSGNNTAAIMLKEKPHTVSEGLLWQQRDVRTQPSARSKWGCDSLNTNTMRPKTERAKSIRDCPLNLSMERSPSCTRRGRDTLQYLKCRRRPSSAKTKHDVSRMLRLVVWKNFRCRVHNSQINPHRPKSTCWRSNSIYCHLRLGPVSGLFNPEFKTKIIVRKLCGLHACYMSCPWYPILQRTQSVLFPYGVKPSFASIQNNGQYYSTFQNFTFYSADAEWNDPELRGIADSSWM